MEKYSYLCSREKGNMLNVNQMTMKTEIFATEAEMWKKVRELIITGNHKIQVIGRRQIIIFK